jgi:ribose 1,5-bisphosphokinase PhnN
MTPQAEKFLDEKWDVISNGSRSVRNTNSRLFDEVVLVLSGIEGKLKFATGAKSWNKDIHQIEDEYTRRVVTETKEKVAEVRKALNDIIVESRENADKFFN